VVIQVKTATAGAKTTPIYLYPEEAGDFRADVTHFGGSAGAFASGRPEVNSTHWGGTVVASANVLIDGAITAAKIATDAITSSKVADGFLTAAKFASGAFDAVWTVATRLLTAGTNIVLAKGTGVTGFNDLSAAQVNTEADTALSDIGATSTRMGYLDNLSGGAVALASSLATLAGKFTGITLMAEWLGLIAGKQTGNSTARTELRATGAGSGTFDETTDSQEAIRDRGDASWADSGTPPTPAAIASQVRTELATELARIDVAISTRLASLSYTAPLDAAGIRSAIGIAAANLDIQLDALPTNAELATALAAADDATLAAVAALATAVAALPTSTQNADELLKRDMAAVTGEASRSLLNAIRFIRNKWTIAGGVLTVFKEDDSTSAWTGAATQTAGNPVSEIDPA
jgi:hypothetical protein